MPLITSKQISGIDETVFLIAWNIHKPWNPLWVTSDKTDQAYAFQSTAYMNMHAYISILYQELMEELRLSFHK